MAIILKNKFVDDLNANQAIGVSIPFSSTSVFNQTFDTATQIKSNLINYFLTNKGERLLNPTYGGDLRNFLFEQLTINTDVDIRTYLVNQISTVFNNITIEELDINFDEERNQMNISFNFTYNTSGETDTIELTL